MKRLLAYLLIVLGLGLVFSLNAYSNKKGLLEGENKLKSKKETSTKYCIKKKGDDGKWPFYKEIGHIQVFYDGAKCPKNMKRVSKFVFTKFKKKIDDKYVPKTIASQSTKNKTQIAKAEPSQTQEIVGAIYSPEVAKKSDWRKEFELIQNKKVAKKEPSQTQEVEGNIDNLNLNDKYLLAPGMRAYFFTGQYQKEQKKDDSFIILSTPTFIKYYNYDLEKLIAIDKLGNWKMTNITKENYSKHLKLRISAKTYFKMADVMNVEGRNNIFKSIIDKGEKDKLTDLIDEYLSHLVRQKKITKNKARKKKLLLTEYFLNKDKQIQIAKVEPTVTPKKKKKVKVAKTTQEEFKPETGDIDNDAPVIEIAEAITVVSQSYTIKGTVKDKSKQIYLEINGRPVEVKKGKFELDRFNIDPDVVEELKIVAIDQWNNRSEKIVKVTVELQSTEVVRTYEELKPNRVKVKIDKDKIAIIIGIEKYEKLINLDAKYANRDAQAFRTYATRALGIKPSNIKVLIDDKADRGNTLEVFKLWLPKIANNDGKDIYVFFAGHGLASENGKDLYILPHDGKPKMLGDTAITRVELISLIQKVNPKSVTMFFDTCYSGQTRDERMLVASLLRPIQIVAEEQDTPDNFTIFSASNFDQASGGIEEAKHGMFSYYLMKGLEGKADIDPKDNKITNGELIAYLKTNVSKEAFAQNRAQDPMLSGDPDKILMSYR